MSPSSGDRTIVQDAIEDPRLVKRHAIERIAVELRFRLEPYAPGHKLGNADCESVGDSQATNIGRSQIPSVSLPKEALCLREADNPIGELGAEEFVVNRTTLQIDDDRAGR